MKREKVINGQNTSEDANLGWAMVHRNHIDSLIKGVN